MLEPLISRLNHMHVVLASSSVQRANLLKSTTVKFEIFPSNFEENLDPAKFTFSDYVEQTAVGKVKDVLKRLEDEGRRPDLIIGVDTMVTFNGKLYGKPKDRQDAIKTITDITQTKLPNSVYSGVVVWHKDQFYKFTEVTTVYMQWLTDPEIKAYVDTGEPMGKAGGYGIQGIASSFVKRVEGDTNNVIGLPLCKLAQLLKKILL